MPSLIDIVSASGQALNKARVASDREQPSADWELDVEFGRVTRAERMASNCKTRLKPVRREMQKVEPVVPSSSVSWLVPGKSFYELRFVP